MRRVPDSTNSQAENGRLEFALIVAAIVLATIATYLALSKKLAVLAIEFATLLGWTS